MLRFFFSALLLLTPALPAFAQDAAIDRTRDEFYTATVVSIVGETRDEDPSFSRTVQTVRLRLNGTGTKEEITLENGILDNRPDMRLKEGETIVVEKLLKSDGSTEYLIKEKYRLPHIIVLIVIFVIVALILGGLTGIMSIAGLFVSIGILVFFVIPRILAGDDPLLSCLIGSVLIACTSLFLAHGFNIRTRIALLSTLLTLCVSAAVALLFVHAGKLFGMGTEEAMFLQTGILQNLDLRGLLLGGIIIGCLGVLDDITTAQTAAIDEIRKANPSLGKRQLLTAGFSVGKEHIASLINTLALAYVGTSLPLLLLLHSQSNQAFPAWVTLNAEFLGEEIVRTLVGSITLLCAVPISTWIAVTMLHGKKTPETAGGHHHHHHLGIATVFPPPRDS